jgi:acetyl esterase/lipase
MHTDNLILGPVDIVQFGNAWTSGEANVQIPEISPLFESDFRSMPPAVFLVGDKDALVDDSYFAAIKWHMAGNETELVLFPGSYHGFLTLPGPDANAGLRVNEQFIMKNIRRVA